MDTLKNWLEGLDYEVLSGAADTAVSEVSADSREAGPGTVFVCISGSRIDAHKFIPDAISRGCRCIVAEKNIDTSAVPSDVCLVRVESTKKALALLSSARFGHPSRSMRMIGITGTKGKTSTSYILKAILEECGHKAGLIGTNGCMIGDVHFSTRNTTPGSYELNSYFKRMLDSGCDTVVMECSSQGFKLDRTYGIYFDYGIFLNLSPDHIGPMEHADLDEYIRCKSVLFSQCRTAVMNRDDSLSAEMLSLSGNSYERLLEFSLADSAVSLYADDIRFISDSGKTGSGFSVHGLYEGRFYLSVPGKYNVSNALSALTVAFDLGLPVEGIRAALEKVHVDGRMEEVYKSDRFTCIVDYAHNGSSMINLLETLREYDHKRLVVVFGCGGNRDRERRRGMAEAAAGYADFSVITSDNSRFEKTEDIMADIEKAYLAAGGSPAGYIKIADRSNAIRYAMANASEGDIIAVIGKGHEDYQEENGIRRHFLDREEILKIRDELGL